MKIIIASNNKNKILEIKNKFHDLKKFKFGDLSSIGYTDEITEDGNTFQENALKKAVVIARYSGITAMSDDSGLVIDALGGRPGVFSARYGGNNLNDEGRNRLILEEMKGIKMRNARFISVIAIALPDGSSRIAQGACEGEIFHELRGGKGFGYDPIFYLPQYKKTMAELTLEEKNRISHRAIALDGARKILMEIIQGNSNI